MNPADVRVMHLSVVHGPDEPRIYERECRSLAEAGYNVAYLVPGATPSCDDVGVYLLPLPPRPRSKRWMSAKEILSVVRSLKPHIVHIHDPELLTLFPVLKLFVPRLVYDMHDYVPQQVMAKEYIPARLRPAVATASDVGQKSLASVGHGVVTAYEEMLTLLGPRPQLRTVAPNYPRLTRFTGAAPIPELANDPRLKLVYIGSLSRTRGCSLMLDVMERLDRDDAVLYLGGSFASKDLEDEVRSRLAGGLSDRVLFFGRVPPPELPRYLASAEVVWMPSLPSVQYARPNVETKIYEGMAVGLASLVSDMSGRGEFVHTVECGIAVPPDVDGHLGGIRRLIAERGEIAAMGERGREAVQREFSWEAAQADLLSFYATLCAGL